MEDIQALIALAKKQPKQQMMATYYAKLTQIFAMSGHHMYHAYAWLKLFSFSKSYNKNLSGGGARAWLRLCLACLAGLCPSRLAGWPARVLAGWLAGWLACLRRCWVRWLRQAAAHGSSPGPAGAPPTCPPLLPAPLPPRADLQMMGISTLLATLSILPYERSDADQDAMAAEQEKERVLKMANILGFTVVRGAARVLTRGLQGPGAHCRGRSAWCWLGQAVRALAGHCACASAGRRRRVLQAPERGRCSQLPLALRSPRSPPGRTTSATTTRASCPRASCSPRWPTTTCWRWRRPRCAAARPLLPPAQAAAPWPPLPCSRPPGPPPAAAAGR